MASTRRKLEPSFTGMTLEQWRSQTELVAWAQREPVFRQIGYALLNELPKTTETIAGCSESRALGRVEGFKMALMALRSMASKLVLTPEVPEPTFETPEDSLETPDVHD